MRAARLAKSILSRSFREVLEHGMMLQTSDDAEAVHDARVAALRLRSELRTFRSMLDRAWVESLRDQLQRLRDELSRIRDTDVLLERLDRDIAELEPADRSRAGAVLEICRQAQADARMRFRSVQQEPGYRALFERLADEDIEKHFRRKRKKRAAPLARRLLCEQLRRLKKCIRRFDKDPSETRLHHVRIQTKHLRYLAEACECVFGKDARRLAKKTANLQTVLGEHHDAELGYEKVQQLAKVAESMGSAEIAFIAGELAVFEMQASRRMRQKWPKAWKKVKRVASAVVSG